MFVAAGAGGTVRADTGLVDFGQGALDGGPEAFDLAKKVPAELAIGRIWIRHDECILQHIHK
jgi:hypothetical protein